MKYGIKVTNPLNDPVRFVITNDGEPVRRKILKPGEDHLFRLDEAGVYDVQTTIMSGPFSGIPWRVVADVSSLLGSVELRPREGQGLAGCEVREASWQLVNHEDAEGGKLVPQPKKAEQETPKVRSLSEMFEELKKEEVPA